MKLPIAVALLLFPSLALAAPPTSIAPPRIPDKQFLLTDFGAVPDGKTLATEAFKKAVDAIKANHGGVLVVPRGTFLSAPFALTSNMALQLNEGAVIKATDDFSAFGLPNPLPAAQADADKLKLSVGNFITVDKADNFEIRSEAPGKMGGTIDGSGEAWWKHVNKPTYYTPGAVLIPRPRLLSISDGSNVYVHDVTLTNSPTFHLVPRRCTNVLIDHVSIIAPEHAPNTDAMDPSNCNNVLIKNCTLDVGDDDVAIKSGGASNPPCENILITDCTIKHGHGVSIGSETDAGVHHMLVQNSTFDGTNPALRIKSSRSRGGDVSDVTYQNLQLKNIQGNAIELNMMYEDKNAARETKPVTPTTPKFHDLTFKDITVASSKTAGLILGLPESPITNVSFTNVSLHGTAGLTIRDASNITFTHSPITAEKGDPLTQSFATITQNP